MNTEPGENLTGMPKEKSEKVAKPALEETLVGEVMQDLEGMDQSFAHIEQRGIAIDTGVAGVFGGKGTEIKARNQSLLERAKMVTSRYKEAMGMYTRLVLLGGLVLIVPGERFQDHRSLAETIAAAKSDLTTSGITQEQRSAYIPGVNDLLYRNISPIGYDFEQSKYARQRTILERVVSGREETTFPAREDAWRMYLGIPQKYNSFGISEYRPSQSKDDTYYYKIHEFLEGKFAVSPDGGTVEQIRKLVLQIQESKSQRLHAADGTMFVMGEYTWSMGQDAKGHYISYYDKWDVDIPIEKDGFFGKPFEIYDRLYYDPETFEPLAPLKPTSLQELK